MCERVFIGNLTNDDHLLNHLSLQLFMWFMDAPLDKDWIVLLYDHFNKDIWVVMLALEALFSISKYFLEPAWKEEGFTT